MQDLEEADEELLRNGRRVNVLEEADAHGPEEGEQLGKAECEYDRPLPSKALRVIDSGLVAALPVCGVRCRMRSR